MVPETTKKMGVHSFPTCCDSRRKPRIQSWCASSGQAVDLSFLIEHAGCQILFCCQIWPVVFKDEEHQPVTCPNTWAANCFRYRIKRRQRRRPCYVHQACPQTLQSVFRRQPCARARMFQASFPWAWHTRFKCHLLNHPVHDERKKTWNSLMCASYWLLKVPRAESGCQISESAERWWISGYAYMLWIFDLRRWWTLVHTKYASLRIFWSSFW